jgi:hypothetical protein
VEEIAPLSVFGEGRLWRLFFRPGLESAFGPLWWLVLLLIGVGLVAAIATRRDSYVRMVGFVAAVSTLGYLVTPASIGTKKIPNQFVYSLRYMAGAAVLAVVALAISALGRRFRRPLFWMFVAVVIAMQLDPSIWPTDLRAQRFWEPVHGAFSVAAVVFGVVVLVVGCALVVVRWRAPAWRPSLLLSVALVMAAVVTGAVVHDVYVRNQLEDSWYLPATYRWARSVHDERIAVVGTPLQYPLYGEDLSNHVQYVGRRGRHGSFFPINTCRAWRRALTAGRYDYVVIAANPVTFRRRIEATWTESDPGAALELRDGDATVFRIDAPLDPDGCDQLGPRAIARTNSE